MYTRHLSKETIKTCKKIHGKTIIYHWECKITRKVFRFKALVLANPKIADTISIKFLAKPETIHKKLVKLHGKGNGLRLETLKNPTFCIATFPFKFATQIAEGKRDFESITGFPVTAILDHAVCRY